AHPHSAGPIAVVHNGIVENHVAVRQELEAQGIKFLSDTDTEIVAHLIHRELNQGAKTLFEATQRALRRVVGAYAIAVLSRAEPDVTVGARNGPPLVLGIGEDEMLCGSDIPALLAHTRKMVFLEDGDTVELRAKSFRIETVTGDHVERKTRHIDWSPVQAE